MDVDLTNFEEALSLVKSALPTTAFVSIDLEFTGLGVERPSHLDTPSDRYRAARESSQSFPPLQCGLSLFRIRSPAAEDDIIATEHDETTPAAPDGVASNDAASKDAASKDAASSLPAGPPFADAVPSTNAASTAAPPVDAPPVDAPPVDAPPVDAPPVDAPPVDAPPVDAPSNAAPSAPDTRPSPVWEVLPFNFQLLPRAVYRKSNSKYPMRDRIMQLQSSSVEFLIRHGFDFLSCFENGISWLRKPDEGDLLAELRASFRPRGAGAPAPRLNEREREICKQFRHAVATWLAAERTAPGTRTSLLARQYDAPRGALQHVLDKHFPAVTLCYARGGRAVAMPARWVLELEASAAAASARAEEMRRRDFDETCARRVRDAVGFRRVFDAVLECGRPLVVHHGLLDITKALANFVAPLPGSLSLFKQAVSGAFPVVWDTRVLLADAARRHGWVSALLGSERGRSISGIIDAFRDPQRSAHVPPLRLRVSGDDGAAGAGAGAPPRFSRYDSTSNGGQYAHEAGFDALQTGRVFLYLLGMIRGAPVGEADVLGAATHADFHALANRVYMGSCGGYLDIDIAKHAVGAERAVEDAVEDSRNAWLRRSDVLVVSDVHDDQSRSLETYEIPYRVYDRVVADIVRGTAFCARDSVMYPCESGTCIVELKRKKWGKAQSPRKKKKKTGGGAPAAPVPAAAGAGAVEMGAASQTAVRAGGSAPTAGSGDVEMGEAGSGGRQVVAADATKVGSEETKGASEETKVAAEGTKVAAEGAKVAPEAANVRPADANGSRALNGSGGAARGDDGGKESAAGKADAADVDKEEIAKVYKAAKALGLTVKTYAESIRTGKPRRMRVVS